MENQETPEQKRIKELEIKVLLMEEDIAELELINAKLGYSTRIMSEFHLTQDDKEKIANSIDLATKISEIETVYEEYKKLLYNKGLHADLEEFQMSPDFKENILNYLAVSMGYDPIEKIESDIQIVSEYFSFENKIRSTPDAAQRQSLTDALLKKRAGTIEALNSIIDTVNGLSAQSDS